jgi:hypothetical protein
MIRKAQLNPDDQALIVRASMAFRRMGQELPEWLKLRELFSSFDFYAPIPLTVSVVLPDGSISIVGRTPSEKNLKVPVHRSWWILPDYGCSEQDLVQVLHHYSHSGLAVPPHFTDDNMTFLKKLNNIERLDFGGCSKISHKSLRHLSELKNLRWLSLWFCPSIKPQAFTAISKAPLLETLDLSFCRNLVNRGLKPVTKLKNLVALKLGNLPELAQKDLSPLTQLKKLSVLDLRACTELSAEDLTVLRACPSLTILNLSSCTALSPSAVDVLSEMPTLREVIVIGCQQSFVEQAIQQLAKTKCSVLA